MNNFNLRKLFLPLVALLLLLSSCNLDNSKDEKNPSIIGTWIGEYGGTYVISETEFTSTGADGTKYTCGEVVKVTDDTSETGYLVFKYTESYTKSLLGNYGVIRWYDLTEESARYIEGYKVSNPEETDWMKQTPIIFSTAEEAENEMNDSFFTGNGTKLSR